LWERLTVRLNLLTHARLQGLADAAAQVDRVLSLVDLADRADELAGKLSKGLKQRAALARALLHRPPIVLLDEPTSGLDPASARHVRDLIAQLRRDGRAVLVSTHNLAEAEELADRIAIIKTRLLALDSVATLRQSGAGTKVVFEFSDGATEHVAITDIAEVPDLVRARVAAGRHIVRVTPDRRSLEEVYLDLVGAGS
jgi:ABC-2 type transport system ATP-binding protein